VFSLALNALPITSIRSVDLRCSMSLFNASDSDSNPKTIGSILLSESFNIANIKSVQINSSQVSGNKEISWWLYSIKLWGWPYLSARLSFRLSFSSSEFWLVSDLKSKAVIKTLLKSSNI